MGHCHVIRRDSSDTTIIQPMNLQSYIYKYEPVSSQHLISIIKCQEASGTSIALNGSCEALGQPNTYFQGFPRFENMALTQNRAAQNTISGCKYAGILPQAYPKKGAKVSLSRFQLHTEFIFPLLFTTFPHGTSPYV